MSFDSLDAFVAELQRHGELVQISAEVDPYLEISEITNRVVKAGGPALLFTNVRGSDVPACSPISSARERRMAMAFDAQSLDEVGGPARAVCSTSRVARVARFADKLAGSRRFAPLANAIPKIVTRRQRAKTS